MSTRLPLLTAVLATALLSSAAFAETEQKTTTTTTQVTTEQKQPTAPQTPCTLSITPPGGAVIGGSTPPLRVTATTNQGCTASFAAPAVVVPANAYNPNCNAMGGVGTAANTVVVTCAGVPAANTPPTSALSLSFTCSCPPSMGLADNNKTETYLF